jgi:putative transposase
MARYRTPQFSAFPFHITDRCPNRDHFPLPLDRVWKILCEDLSLAHYKNGLRIHAFVLMPNHFHLLASVTEVPLGKVLCEFLSSSSRAMNLESGKINQRWGSRAFKCEVASYHYYMNAYKYIYQNPVRAQLCEKSEYWPYSTLNSLLGMSRLSVPLQADLLFSPDGCQTFDSANLDWINQRLSAQDALDMRKALMKTRFKLPKRKNKASPLETHLI